MGLLPLLMSCSEDPCPLFDDGHPLPNEWEGDRGGLWVLDDGSANVFLHDGCLRQWEVVNTPILVDPELHIAEVELERIHYDSTSDTMRVYAERAVILFACERLTIWRPEREPVAADLSGQLPWMEICVDVP